MNLAVGFPTQKSERREKLSEKEWGKCMSNVELEEL